MNGRLDGCLIVSCCEDNPEELIKEIVHSELPEPAQLADDTKAFPWPIETKYYTATIYLHSTSAPVSRYDDSAENIHGLIVLFDPGQKESLDSAAKWIEKCSCEVVLLVCGRCPANNEADGMSRQQVLEWCIDRGCELIETRPSEDDDEEDATGVKRIVEALHAHPWPNLEMKDSTRPGGTRERSTARAGSDGSQAELMTAQRELELFSEAMADGDDMSFEELFAKFQDMKVEADKLSGEDRKKFAEKRWWNIPSETPLAFGRPLKQDRLAKHRHSSWLPFSSGERSEAKKTRSVASAPTTRQRSRETASAVLFCT